MKVFDYLASYHLKSTFLFSYYSPAIMDVANRPLPDDFMASKTSSAPILWIARNCGASSGRQHYVKELMKYIKVDSYGSCLNNRKFPNDKSREELMREYKFYLAIENANCDDYGVLICIVQKLLECRLTFRIFLTSHRKAIWHLSRISRTYRRWSCILRWVYSNQRICNPHGCVPRSSWLGKIHWLPG